MPQVALHRHPATPCACANTVTVQVDWLSDDLMVLYYRIEGDVDALQLPPQRRSAHSDGLWRTTCFEAFIRAPGASEYLELNFSPSSEWAIYRFDDYRRGMRPLQPRQAPKIICRRRENELVADIDVHLAGLGLPASGAVELALSAVLQDQNGALSYWALTHPGDQPDFHHAGSFTLKLPRSMGQQ